MDSIYSILFIFKMYSCNFSSLNLDLKYVTPRYVLFWLLSFYQLGNIFWSDAAEGLQT